MSQENHRTVLSQFLLALILAGLSACQPLAIQSSESPDSQHNQKVASSAPIAFENRTASIVVEREEGNRYKLSWPPIPGAAYYKLFLDGELVKDQLKTSQYQMDISQLSWGLHKLGYESFNRNHLLIGYLAQEWDLRPLLPEPIKSIKPCPEIEMIDLWTYQDCYDGITYTGSIEKNIIFGKIYSDSQRLLAGTKVLVRLINSRFQFSEETISTDGIFHLVDIPVGYQVEIIASKTGYTTRRRLEIVKSPGKSDPNANRYDFGADVATASGFSAPYNGLSDKPEVTLAIPSRNQKQASPNTAFVLTFSEPMDRQSLENSFAIRSFVPSKLSVDVHSEGNTFKGTVPIQREYQPESFKTGETLPNYSNLAQYPSGTPIFDSSAFNISWNADDTQATFAFKPGKALPTDKEPARLPIFTLAFDAFANHERSIRDKSGVARSEKHFKLTDGDFEEALAFEVQADTAPPRLEKLVQLDLPMRALAFALNFSEPMLLKTHSLNISGGMADTLESCKLAPAGYPDAKICTPTRAAQNYTLTVKAADGRIKFQGPWSLLGGEAHYDPGDPSFKRVLLSASTLPFLLAEGDSYEVQALPNITDPAGNQSLF